MKTLAFLFTFCLLSLGAHAQDALYAIGKASDSSTASTPPSMEEIAAIIRQRHGNVVAVQLAGYSSPESIKLIAEFMYNLFEALVAQGFTEEQALEIVTSIGLPFR
ncbi:MAG: hypothetical protein AAGF57_19015 [Pseudomonadota bacterium]